MIARQIYQVMRDLEQTRGGRRRNTITGTQAVGHSNAKVNPQVSKNVSTKEKK
jgi:hypothetical protein